MNKRLSLLLLLFATIIYAGNAQDDETVEFTENIFKGTRFINLQSANLAEEGELQLHIQHRFGDISDGLYSLFGLDLASMRLAFEYGFTRNFSVEIGRSSMFKTYDGSFKIRFARQSTSFPLTITTSAGASIPTERNYFPDEIDKFSDKYSGNAQLHLAKTIGRIGLQVTPGYLYTGYYRIIETNSYKNLDVITLGLGGSVKLSSRVAVNLEYLHHFDESIAASKALSAGVDLTYGGHLFQLMISNTQAMHHQAVFTNTYGDWGKGNIYFGFNLIREFKLKYTEYDF